MCNAWNHHIGCTCGWGGEGHRGRKDNFSGSALRLFENIPPITRYIESHTNPNAKCPVCGAAVFFYASPSGGRVFFDDLGPPWPKHPCTDKSSIPVPLPLSSRHSVKHSWERNGWLPFYISEVKSIYKYVTEIKGIYEFKEIAIFSCNTDQLKNGLKNHLAFLKKTDDSYKLSVLSVAGEAITVQAFANEQQAFLAFSETRRSKVRTHKKTKSVRQCVSHGSRINQKKKPNDHKQPRQLTAIELALIKAKNKPR